MAAPRKPTSDNKVLDKLPLRAGDTSLREIISLRAAAANAPADATAAAALAQAYFDIATARGDPRYVGYAEAIVDNFPTPLPTQLLLLRSMQGQYRHDFSGALNDFAAALALEPDWQLSTLGGQQFSLLWPTTLAHKKECNDLQHSSRKALFGTCMGLVQAYRAE